MNGVNVSARFRWPGDVSFLVDRVRPFVARLAAERTAPPDQEALCRRWLRQTASLARSSPFLSQAAAHDVVLLLIGETGTGKTYLARALTKARRAAASRFSSCPAGSLRPAGRERIFGHVHGAFTGAERNVVGKFGAAGEGTILLDEIDTLGPKEQAGLLRIIETGEYEPIGSHETQRCQAHPRRQQCRSRRGRRLRPFP